MYVNLANFIKTKGKKSILPNKNLLKEQVLPLQCSKKKNREKENLSLSKVNQVLLMFGVNLFLPI